MDARGTQNTPALKSGTSSPAASRASRVFPEPPGPVSVRRRVPFRSCSTTSSISRPRPTNELAGRGRFVFEIVFNGGNESLPTWKSAIGSETAFSRWSPSSRSRRVDPSISVKRNVTVPAGSSRTPQSSADQGPEARSSYASRMLTCPSCGQENPPESRFCNACGAELAADEAAAREYRKVVTILFCDVVGSTALGESTDPEALRALLGRYFDQMKAIVERHGSTVEKFIGDAVMAVFGVPQLHEDDALRAVRAAVEMRDALPELGVEARIGVNTGEVVVGTSERLATGDAVNVAARLEQSAGNGEVLLGPETDRKSTRLNSSH